MDYGDMKVARNVANLVRIGMGVVGFFMGIIAFIMVSNGLDGWWGTGLGILAGLIVWSVMMHLGDTFFERRLNKESAKLFPNLTEEKRAAYWLVSLDTAFGQQAFQDKLKPTILCDGGEYLFMRSGEDFGDKPASLRSPRPVDFPDNSAPWHIAKDDILGLHLHLFNDETITQAGRDPRSTSDRVIEAGVGELMGYRRRMKITPFAAMIELVSRREDRIERAVFAIPTDVDFNKFRPLDWNDGTMEELLSSQVFTGLAADQMAATSDALDDAAEFVGDYGGATIGTLSVLSELVGDEGGTRKGIGNEGRKVALLLADGLRDLAGLEQVEVHQG